VGKFKDKLSSAKRHLKNAAYLVLAYHLAGEARFLYKYYTYSDARTEEFKKITGIDIYAPKENISNNELMDWLRLVKHTETSSKDIDEIIVEDKNYFSKSLIGKMLSIGGKHGHANPITNTMTMGSDLPVKSTIHEITHMKTFSNKKKDELIAEWKKLAHDTSGNSQYMSFTSMVKSYCGVEDDGPANPKLDSLGFPTQYARTNVYEDISEFVERELNKVYYSYNTDFKELSNNIYEKKLDLAIKYGLMPQESKEGYYLKQRYAAWVSVQEKNWWNNHVKEDYLIQSEKFLEKYPNSPFFINIVIDRAMVLSNTSNTTSPLWHEKSEKELQKGLSVPSHLGYGTILSKLEQLAAQVYSHGQESYPNPYSKAITEYNIKVEKFDTSLLETGVNDKLKELGVFKNDK
jgi:hypothetical protein